jgi:DNA polymerase-3 subunit epsilon
VGISRRSRRFFDAINVSVHGINQKAVDGAPKLPDVAQLIVERMRDRVVVCHTHFDRIAILRAFTKHGLSVPTCSWLDSARVARHAWTEFATGGYGLKNVCDTLGYQFGHHDALEDAKAAGHIILAAINKTGLDLEGWLQRVGQGTSTRRDIARDGNPEGQLFGEVLVFTGALATPRREAAEMAAKMGCTVAEGVNKKTTILVVGDQDIRVLAGKEKSSKHIKAESLIAKGQPIRILVESDFKALVCLDV